MKVEITEVRLSDAHEERHYLQHEGDRITVPDALGLKWCSLGWAKDVDGNVPTGERKVTGAELKPHGSAHSSTDTGS